ncbi:phosphotransferase [Streptomyces uncialis]|uniref:Aminoglycoside phosphotransferase n=1 Tax=Streptomyces uncialis TaxID=1048205 RepID=A0A1Q4VD82_9ACTN|nr:phosphotransferase [Streptomyces uncialis]OKH95801.1 aminoglycoside phosphotransferase [Streptomyces uncialis]
MTERVEWDELPSDLRNAVEARTGQVEASESVATGFNCSLAMVLDTRGSGRLFLKGVRVSDSSGMAGLLCEERINGAVRGISATIRHRFELSGWLVLTFTHIDGRHVDYSPGTADLGAVTHVLRRTQSLRAPAFPVPQLSDRFAGHLKPGEADVLHGTHLLHTDTNPHNMLIPNHDGHACLVDWAMPALGPAWVDAAYTARWLMRFGQTPEDALAWLSGVPSWQQAHRKAVETFVRVTCRQAIAQVGERGSATSNTQFRHLLDTPAPRPSRQP